MLARILALMLLAGSALAEVPAELDLDILDAPTVAATTPAPQTDGAADSGAATLVPLPDTLRERLQTGSAGDWSAVAGETLQQTLQRWADSAGWQLIWAARPETNLVLDVDLDYPAGTTMQEAIRTTFKALSRRPAAPKACEYRNKTLRIVNLGDRCD
ncbi:TcpQ domain-containing protein [Ahniella affigens]|nr:TcpQ domain-containing protein [Ahniella affigens]